MTDRWRIPVAILAVVLSAMLGRAADPPQPVRITVVVVLASKDHKEIHPKLVALAEQLQKKDEKLTGFRLEATLEKSIKVGQSHTFQLLDDKTLSVKIDSPKDKTGRIGLTIDAAGMGQIEYTCVCDKFVPILTQHVTKKGEHLVVAILAKPCTGK